MPIPDDQRLMLPLLLTSDKNSKPALPPKVMDSIEFSGRFPTKTELVDKLNEKPSFRQRGTIGERLLVKLRDFVGKFLEV